MQQKLLVGERYCRSQREKHEAGISKPVRVTTNSHLHRETSDNNESNSVRQIGEVRAPAIVSTCDTMPTESESIACSICMEPWTGVGIHRICSLACGHLFGRSCIKHWLKQAGKKFGKCPHCNQKAKIGDIRNLYVPRVIIAEGQNQNVVEELGRLQAENKELNTQNAKLLAEVHQMQAFLAVFCSEQCEALSDVQSTEHGHSVVHDVLSFEQGLTSDAYSRKRPNVFLSQCHEQSSKKLQGPQHISLPLSLKNDDRWEDANGNSLKASTSTHSSLASHLYCEASLPAILYQKESQSGKETPTDWSIPYKSSRHSYTTGVTMLKEQQEISIETSPSSLVCQNNGTSLQSSFHLQAELPLQGAKVFDMDALCQLLLVSQKSSNLKDAHALTKMSLHALSEWEPVYLPPDTGIVRDIHIAPAGVRSSGRLALVASLGKRISILSLESNNVVLTYKLQSPVWSCAWDPSEPDHVYAGLQNGSMSVFDIRQTSLPLSTTPGLSSNPIHSLHVAHDYLPKQVSKRTNLKGKGVVSASSGGVCFWCVNTSGGKEYRPYCLPRLENQGVCVSLAYNAMTDVAVATFRQKPGSQGCLTNFSSLTEKTSLAISESSLRQVPYIMSQPCQGAHFIVKRKVKTTENSDIDEPLWLWEHERVMIGRISHVGMSRSAIFCGSRPGHGDLFAFGDEPSKGLWLWDMETLNFLEQLKPHPSPILDVRSINASNRTIIGCMSERRLQLYSHSEH